MSDRKEERHEELLICRCADCETSNTHGCNSSRLKALLGNLFDNGSADNVQGLHCRGKIGTASLEATFEGCECLCGECELLESNRKYHCKSLRISGE